MLFWFAQPVMKRNPLMPLSNFTLTLLHVYDFQTTLIGRIAAAAQRAERCLVFGSLAAPTEDPSPRCVADRL